MCPSEKYFDGYNTIREYDHAGCFLLIKYYADEYYCGDRNKLFAVRAGSEDILDFRTLLEARMFFKLTLDTCRKCEEEDRRSDTIDEALKAWKEVA